MKYCGHVNLHVDSVFQSMNHHVMSLGPTDNQSMNSEIQEFLASSMKHDDGRNWYMKICRYMLSLALQRRDTNAIML